MTSEIRTNSIKSRTGLSTVSYADTGIIVSGIVTATSFVGALPISNDSNNRVITATGSGGLNGEANLTYDGTTLNIIDSAGGSGSHRLTIGNSHDLRLYHDGNTNIGHYGAGDFYLTSNSGTDLYVRSADDIFLQPQDGENGIIVTGNGSVALFYDNVSMLETEARGAFVKKADGGETLFTIGSTNAGGVRLALDGDSNGDATGFDYAYLQHNSSGDLIISADNPAGNSNLIFQAGNSSEYLRIDSSGRILIGTTQYTTNKGVVIYGESGRGADVVFQNANTGTGTGNNGFYVGNGTGAASYVWNYENADLYFATNNTERLRIASNGQATFTGNKVRINGGTTARSIDVETTHGSGGEIASFQNNDSGNYGGLVISGGEIDRECRLEAAWGSGFMTFWADNAERMRINSGGDVFIGTTTVNPGIGNYQTPGTMIRAAAGDYIAVSREQGCPAFFNRDNSTGVVVSYRYNATERGTISTDGSVIAVTGTSDYRLKENNVNISDGITRLKQLKPYRFNFKDTPSRTIDGFFAHEVSTAVPEAVFGEKDAVATEEDIDLGYKVGDIKAQQLDQSKLVPLLTAALQEVITKVEILEQENVALRARVTNLEGN